MSPTPVDNFDALPPLRWGAGFDEALADLSRSLPASIPALSACDHTELGEILRPKPTRWKAYRVPGDNTWRLCPADCAPIGPHGPDCEGHPSQAAAVAALWERVDTLGTPR